MRFLNEELTLHHAEEAVFILVVKRNGRLKTRKGKRRELLIRERLNMY